MFNFSFNLIWPNWINHCSCASCQHNYFDKHWKITKNKTVEIQAGKGGSEIVGMNFEWSTRRDHAGIILDFSLIRRFLIISITDNRHWNTEENRYVNYDNPEEVEKYW